MIAVGLDIDQLKPLLDRLSSAFGQLNVSVVCYNSPSNQTISEDRNQINLLKNMLNSKEVFVQQLQVDVAYHSSHMSKIADQYLNMIQDLKPRERCRSQSPAMISTVTSQLVCGESLRDSNYWVKNLISPVNFMAAINFACSRIENVQQKLNGNHENTIPVSYLLEVGPHSALQAPIKEILKSIDQFENVGYDSLLVRHLSASDTVLNAIGRLYCAGYPIIIDRVNRPLAKKSNLPQLLVDLPEYPFDHSKSYWSEGRLSRSFRFRKHARLDLLGTPVSESNSYERRWRHTLKVSELPWMEDHKVLLLRIFSMMIWTHADCVKINQSVLYPGAGMIVMAIEAMKQTARPSHKLVGFCIKDIFFQAPLNIPLDREGVDIEFSLLSSSGASDKIATWSEFRLYSIVNDDNILVCRGYIKPQYEDSNSAVGSGREHSERNKTYDVLHQAQLKSCSHAIDTESMYRHLDESGLQYGPTFRCLEELSYSDKGEAMGQLVLFKWIAERGANHCQEHVIHPTSLDGLFQMLFVAVSQGGNKDLPTSVLTRIHNLWVSNEQLSYPSEDSITVCAKIPSMDIERGAFVFALSNDNKTPLIIADGVEAKNITNARSPPSKSRDVKLSYAIDWKPDLSVMGPRQQSEYFEGTYEHIPEPVEFFQDLQFIILAFIDRTLKSVDRQKLAASEQHYQNYFDWMKMQAQRFHAGTLTGGLPKWKSLLQDSAYQDMLSGNLSKTNIQGHTYVEVGRNLVDILHGVVDPLALLFQSNLVSDYYEEISNSVRFLSPVTRYLQALAHKQPNMKLLEIGAGTGGMTRHVLKSLTLPNGDDEFGTQLFSSYEFTDVSRSFFVDAQARLGPQSSHSPNLTLIFLRGVCSPKEA